MVPPRALLHLFKQDFSCPVLLFERPLTTLFAYGAITLYNWTFQTILLNVASFIRSGSFPFARRYSGNLG
jgi:hypothetical protein